MIGCLDTWKVIFQHNLMESAHKALDSFTLLILNDFIDVSFRFSIEFFGP